MVTISAADDEPIISTPANVAAKHRSIADSLDEGDLIVPGGGREMQRRANRSFNVLTPGESPGEMNHPPTTSTTRGGLRPLHPTRPLMAEIDQLRVQNLREDFRRLRQARAGA